MDKVDDKLESKPSAALTVILCVACAAVVGVESGNNWYGIATFLGLTATIVGRRLQ